MNDIYDPIRRLLPPRARIAFVFKDLNRDLVFYTEGLSPKIQQSFYDGKSLMSGSQALQAMIDDGLSQPIGAARPVDRMHLFKNQFRAINKTDALLAEILLGMKNDPRRTKINLWKIALGVETVFVKPHMLSDSTYVMAQQDWSFGDDVVRLMLDYPYRMHDGEFNTGNSKILLGEMGSLLEQAPRSETAKRLIEQIWMTVQNNLEVAEYHDDLAPLFIRVREASRDLLMGS